MSRSLKEIIDYSTFTDPKTSHDLYSNSIRRGFEFDAYGDRDTFQAVVLTDPIPTDPKQINLFTGGESDGSEKISQFTYRARIIGVNSPHDFLPDPCDSTYASGPLALQAEKLVAMHTLFVSKEEDGVGSSLPRKGSTVEVKLTKNVFSYNLQIGEHLKVISNPQQSSANNVECDSLQSIMNNAVALPLSSATPRTDRQTNFVDILTYEMQKNNLEAPFITSWSRDPATQVRLVFGKSESEVDALYNNEVLAFYRNQDPQGMLAYYSSRTYGHLGGRAVDVRTKDRTSTQVTQMLAIIRGLDANPLLEPLRGGCWVQPGRSVVNAQRNTTESEGDANTTAAKCAQQHIHVDIPDKYETLTFEKYLSATELLTPEETPAIPLAE